MMNYLNHAGFWGEASSTIDWCEANYAVSEMRDFARFPSSFPFIALHKVRFSGRMAGAQQMATAAAKMLDEKTNYTCLCANIAGH